jgi:hypothetical protein
MLVRELYPDHVIYVALECSRGTVTCARMTSRTATQRWVHGAATITVKVTSRRYTHTVYIAYSHMVTPRRRIMAHFGGNGGVADECGRVGAFR